MKQAVFGVLVLAFLATGCAARTAQVAVQTSLTAMAEGVNTGAGIIVDRLPEASAENTARVYAAVQRGEILPRDALAVYDGLMFRWNQAITAFEYARAVLQLGQSAVDVWVETGELPEYWGRFCDNIGGALQDAVDFLELCGVEVPTALETAIPMVSGVCETAGAYFVSGD